MRDRSNLPTVVSRITEYLDNVGLWNPELADHAAVRDLICDARDEIDRLRDDLQKQADWADWAKGEIDRLRVRCRQIDDEAYDYAEQIEQLKAEIDRLRAAAKDSADHYADARAEIDRLRRILAALREPSEAMVADAAEYVLGYHEPDYRDIRTAIRAAVAAAEQEVDRA